MRDHHWRTQPRPTRVASPAIHSESSLQPGRARRRWSAPRSEEHTSELQSHSDLVCRLLLEKKKPAVRVTRLDTNVLCSVLSDARRQSGGPGRLMSLPDTEMDEQIPPRHSCFCHSLSPCVRS